MCLLWLLSEHKASVLTVLLDPFFYVFIRLGTRPDTEIPNLSLPCPHLQNRHGAFVSHIYYARVLEKVDHVWSATGEEAAVKAVSWNVIRACHGRDRLSEDFIKEVAALGHISRWQEDAMPDGDPRSRSVESKVLAADAVMSSETHLFVVMPYCAGGDLCERVADAEEMQLGEEESRYWFRQILKASPPR